MVNAGEPANVVFAKFTARPFTIVAIVVITAVVTLADGNSVGRANGIKGVGKFLKGGTMVLVVIAAAVVVVVVTIVFIVVVIARIVVAVTLLTTVGAIGAYG